MKKVFAKRSMSKRKQMKKKYVEKIISLSRLSNELGSINKLIQGLWSTT